MAALKNIILSNISCGLECPYLRESRERAKSLAEAYSTHSVSALATMLVQLNSQKRGFSIIVETCRLRHEDNIYVIIKFGCESLKREQCYTYTTEFLKSLTTIFYECSLAVNPSVCRSAHMLVIYLTCLTLVYKCSRARFLEERDDCMQIFDTRPSVHRTKAGLISGSRSLV